MLLFNLRISEGGDDSTYIIRAYKFLKQGTYPSYQGPLYPVFLSFIIGISGGIKLGLLKFTSFIFMLVFYPLFFNAYKDRIPPLTLFAAFLIISVNSFILYFASQTYSEAMFMALTGWFFLLFFNYLDKDPTGIKNMKSLDFLKKILLK